VTYGKNTATLGMTVTGSRPKPHEEVMDGRFAGVLKAVTDALPKLFKPGPGEGVER
jgi:hypothetical protein